MAETDYLTYGFAAVVAVGGIFGYVKAGSIASLVMGLASGSALAYGAHLASLDRRNFLLPFSVSLILLGVMGTRFVSGGKFMPAGLVASMSLMQVVRFGYRFIAE